MKLYGVVIPISIRSHDQNTLPVVSFLRQKSIIKLFKKGKIYFEELVSFSLIMSNYSSSRKTIKKPRASSIIERQKSTDHFDAKTTTKPLQKNDNIPTLTVIDKEGTLKEPSVTNKDLANNLSCFTTSNPDTKNRSAWRKSIDVLSSKTQELVNLLGKRLRNISGKDANSPPSTPNTPIMSLQVFGIKLSLLLERNETEKLLPSLPLFLMDYIEKYGLGTVGIFRVSGDKTKVNFLIEKLNRGMSTEELQENLLEMASTTSTKNKDFIIYDTCELLGHFIRELPDSLIGFDNYKTVISLADETNKEKKLLELQKVIFPNTIELDAKEYEIAISSSGDEKIQEVSAIEIKLNRRFLVHFLKFLKKVHDNSVVNKMDADGLAACFGLSIIKCKDDDALEIAKNVKKAAEILSFMIQNADEFIGF